MTLPLWLALPLAVGLGGYVVPAGLAWLWERATERRWRRWRCRHVRHRVERAPVERGREIPCITAPGWRVAVHTDGGVQVRARHPAEAAAIIAQSCVFWFEPAKDRSLWTDRQR